MTDKITIERETLLPCPFCGDDGDKGRQEVTQMIEGRNKFTRITCRACGAMCPEENWNRRAALAAQPAVLLESTRAWSRAIAQEERACRAEDALVDLVNQVRKTSPICHRYPKGAMMREEFEAWVKNPHMMNKSTAPDNAGEYTHPWTVGAWSAWQAATEREAQICDGHASIEGIAQKCAAAIRATSATPPKAL